MVGCAWQPGSCLSRDRVGDPVGGLLHPACVLWDVLVPQDTKAAARTDPAAALWFEHVNGFFPAAPAAMPGDDLLFQRLSVSTIGAVWFHGRVRDGIGWVTDAMITKQ